MINISVLGIDLAKNVFQLHGIDTAGKTVLRKKLTRAKVAVFIMQLSCCLIGTEACSSSHYWARKFQQWGHEVRLMSPQFVKPYVKSNKNDVNDAEAIC
jgi:transposase